jgi:phosphatidylglycerol---prolipoprotein diacylglyceryl transferase
MLGILEHPNLDPIIFAIPGTPLALRWYGLMYVLAFGFGYFVLRWAQSTGYLRVKKDEITAIIVAGVLGTFLGGRLGYVLFYQFDRLILNTENLELANRLYMLIAVWEGGMSFHGGVFGVAAAVIYYSWKHKRNVLNIHDVAVLFVPLGVALVRVGNFINGELYGRTINDADGNPITDPEKLPWYAMKFPTDMQAEDGQEALSRALREQWQAANPGKPLSEMPPETMQRMPVDTAAWEQTQHLFPGRYPSQIVQFLFEGMLVLAVCWLLRPWLKKPGQLAGAFLMLYAVFRIPAELIRQPDTQIDPARAEDLGGTAAFLSAIGLTMGQLLSVVIFLGGLAIILVAHFTKLSGEEYTTEQRKGGFWRYVISLLPRKKQEAKEKPTKEEPE